MKRWIGILIVLTLASCGCGRHEEAGDKSAAEASPEAATAADSGVVVLSPAATDSAGITIVDAGPAVLDVTVELPGEVKADSGRVEVVRPRFAGVLHRLSKRVGDPVRQGETIATIQSNESLTDYTVVAGRSGRVVTRGANEGETVTNDTPLYTIVDLSDVWIEFAVYPHQLGAIRRGETARIAPESGDGPRAQAAITYVGPLLSEDTHMSIGRIIQPNPRGEWQPGLFVTVTVVTDHARVNVAVPDEAVVRMTEGPAVFVAVRGGFKRQDVTVGRDDGRMTEIVEGLAAGTRVAARNAFVLKAELEKGAVGE